jgi:hypothetical protein
MPLLPGADVTTFDLKHFLQEPIEEISRCGDVIVTEDIGNNNVAFLVQMMLPPCHVSKWDAIGRRKRRRGGGGGGGGHYLKRKHKSSKSS